MGSIISGSNSKAEGGEEAEASETAKLLPPRTCCPVTSPEVAGLCVWLTSRILGVVAVSPVTAIVVGEAVLAGAAEEGE